jgi:hypothetical protein
VLVLEAGRESHPRSRIPVGFAKLIQNPAANWLYSSEPDDGTGQRRIPNRLKAFWAPVGPTLGGLPPRPIGRRYPREGSYSRIRPRAASRTLLDLWPFA